MELVVSAREMLARRDDLRVVNRTADAVRNAIKPWMGRASTRRLTVAVYELASAHPPLPAVLGVRPTIEYEPLDAQRFVRVRRAGFEGSGSKLTLLCDMASGDLHIFKGERDAQLTLRTHAIDGPSQPARAWATTVMADALDVMTPPVRLVEFDGERGSLQWVVPGAVDLSTLARTHPAYFDALVHSERFQIQRSNIWMLDQSAANLDRQSHNMLAVVDPLTDLVLPIDQDLTYAPIRRVRPMFGIRAYRPRRVSRATFDLMAGHVAAPDSLATRLRTVLTVPEVEMTFTRMADTVAMITRTVDSRGEDAVFFAV